jgi:hypothetical protein
MVPEMHGQAAVAMVMLNACVAVCAGFPESFTCTVKFVVPGTVGVPVICPPEDKLRPVGRVVLLARDHV